MVECELPIQSDLAVIRRYRERFLAGESPGAALPAQLSAAWRRALFLGAEPERDSLPVVDVRPDSPLVAAAAPVLARLLEQLADTEVSAVLSDAQARILRCWSAGSRINAHLERIQTRPGADLSEATAGNNGINEVLGNKRRGLIEGPQHILGLYQQTVCSGAQLRHPITGQVAGAVSLVCDLDSPRHLLTALTDSTANAIESELLRAAEPRERVLADAYTEAASGADAVLVLDGQTRITSAAAASVLTEQDMHALQAIAAEATRRSWARDHELAIRDGVDVHMRAIWHAGEMFGVTATVRCSHRSRPASRYPETACCREVSELLGSSPAGRQAADVAGRIIAGGLPAMLVGEAGTGKTTVAKALIAASTGSSEPAVLDARLLATESQYEWLARVRAALAHPGVVLRHVEALPDSAADAVLAMLEYERVSGFCVTLTMGRRPGTAVRALLDHCSAGSLELPALRDRAAEIPELMRAFAGAQSYQPPTLTLQAQQAMTHYRWPGNLSELRQVTRRLLTEHSGNQAIGLGLLPVEVSKCARGRALSTIESAEYSAIRDALDHHGGNRLRAAKTLGIARATLYRKLKQYGLQDAQQVPFSR